MVIGNGMIAKAFSEYELDKSYIIYASGVSNSKETRISEFNREFMLLKNIIYNNKDKVLIYFSTVSIDDISLKNTLYIKQKLKFENYIKKHIKKYYIFRLSQVVGYSASPTIVNYLFQKIKTNSSFELWVQSQRNLIDILDVFKIVDEILKNKLYQNQIINIASPYNLSVKKIVEIIEDITNKKAIYLELNKGSIYLLDTHSIENLIAFQEMVQNNEYVFCILNKYYMTIRKILED